MEMILPVVTLRLILILCLIQALAMAATYQPCQDTWGDIGIYFPFGIGDDCYMNKTFEVICNSSFSPPKLFLTGIGMEVDVIFTDGQVRVKTPVISSNCSKSSVSTTGISLSGTPFVFSNVSNRFVATGCDSFALLKPGQMSTIVGGCLSICPNGTYTNVSGCYGISCCQASIPPYIQSFTVNLTNPFSNFIESSSCRSAFMVYQDWFDQRFSALGDLNQLDSVPAILDWAKQQGYCDFSEVTNVSCTPNSTYCWKQMSINQLCICRQCQDFRRCRKCQFYCLYTPGGYNCSCPPRHYNNGYECFPDYVLWGNSSTRTRSIIIGVSSSFGLLLLLIGLWLSYKFIKRRQKHKLKQKFFKRNGGLLLEQELSSTDTHVEQTKLFTSKELETATDNYHVNRILGQGGQGTVYKGMLTDGRVVAIKKSKVVDEDKIDQFINEVVILSQINHRNVVKLFGCCLETEVPLLVYEFIPNGTLFQLLHNKNEQQFQLTWEMRLQIATEVAGALAYLHSAASVPIYHRDIKSSNILLDDIYRAKVADFGTLKSISIDDTHVTTRVQGTFGYLDPEYFQSSQFTEKSDVYSFGVVLVELLTGQKPISTLRSIERRSLATYFLLSMEEDRLFDIVDGGVVNGGKKEEIIGIAKLARSCLNLNGKRRPNMKTVAMEIERIRSSEGVYAINEQEYGEVDYELGDYTDQWETTSSSTRSLTSTFTR